MNKLFSNIKAKCKTISQRRAFNELLSAFISVSDHKFAQEFNELAVKLSKVNFTKINRKIEDKLNDLYDKLEITYEPEYVELVINLVGNPSSHGDVFQNYVYTINMIERKTGTEPSVCLLIGDEVVNFFESNKLL